MKFNPNSEQNACRGLRASAGLLLHKEYMSAGRGLRASAGLLLSEHLNADQGLRVSVSLCTPRVMNTCRMAVYTQGR